MHQGWVGFVHDGGDPTQERLLVAGSGGRAVVAPSCGAVEGGRNTRSHASHDLAASHRRHWLGNDHTATATQPLTWMSKEASPPASLASLGPTTVTLVVATWKWLRYASRSLGL